MAYTLVTLDREMDGQLAIITLNRPERLNALSPEIVADLHDALDEVHLDPEVRVVVITGAGRGFCSGADVGGMARRVDAGGPATATTAWKNRSTQLQRGTVNLATHVRELRQPVIAAVNGVAAGAGMSLSLACDIRIASEEARFAMRFIKRSLLADTGGTHSLPRLVGSGFAAELIFTGKIIDAQTAKEMRLVNRVVPHDQLMDNVRDLAREIAENPPIAVQLDKIAIYRGLEHSLRQSIEFESVGNTITGHSEDFAEGVRSFMEKREPRFMGR